MRVYLVEIGILLDENHKDFTSYNTVYDEKHGYYDEGQFYMANEKDAINYIKDYVKSGVPNTYGIVSISELDDKLLDKYNSLEDMLEDVFPVEHEMYLLDNVRYSLAKMDGEIVENFLDDKEKELDK